MVIENIYSASAGTGKTWTLLNTIFEYDRKTKTPTKNLQEVQEKLKSTLFLSFSNSAVEELKSRIFESIKKCPNKTGCEFDISSIRVYTIHSFALEVARMFRFNLCLPDDVDFTEGENDKIWYDVVDKFFREQWNEDSMEDLIKNDIPQDLKEIKEQIIKLFLTIVDVKKEDFKRYLEKEGDKLFFILELGNDIEKISNETISNNLINDLNERISDIVDILSNEYHTSYMADYTKVINFLDNCDFILRAILKHLGNEYMKRMYQNGTYDYDAIIFLVLKQFVIGQPDKFITKLKSAGWEIENIYFDEAQDNDILQNYFISALGGNEKFKDVNLKIVGDIKQSIYTWRGAYPQAFKEMMKEIMNIGRLKTLRTSYRIKNKSTLGKINELFKKINDEYSGWWYDESRDALNMPENEQNVSQEEPIWHIWYKGKVFEDKDTSKNEKDKKNDEKNKKYYTKEFSQKGKEELQKLLKEQGKIGILTRGRKNILESGIVKELKTNKEFYGNPVFRYRLDTRIKDLSGIDSLLPEINVLKVLYFACNVSTQYLVPYALLFTEPGRLIKDKVAEFKVKDNNDLISNIKEIYERLQTGESDVLNNTNSEKIYKWMDNLWQYMYHSELKDTEWEMPQEVVRTVHHILYNLYLFERDREQMFENRQKQKDIFWQETALPAQWYAIKDSNTENNNSRIIEVNTIHSAKGLEYDSVIIIGDSSQIFDKYGNRSIYKDKYSGMTNVRFEQMLSDKPQIKIKLFPYLGILTSHILKNSNIYENIKNEIMCEQLNLFYVAVTRTKKNMIFIDLAKRPQQDVLSYSDNGIFENKPYQETEIKKISYSQLTKQNDVLSIEKTDIIKTVRDIVKTAENKERRYKKNNKHLNYIQQYEHIVIGKKAHYCIQSALENKEVAQQNNVYIQKAMELLTSKENSKIVNDLKTRREEGVQFLNELNIWGVDFINDNTIIGVKGSIDTVQISQSEEQKKEVSLIEYKVVFDTKNEMSQENLAKSQLNEYSNMISKILDTEKVQMNQDKNEVILIKSLNE